MNSSTDTYTLPLTDTVSTENVVSVPAIFDAADATEPFGIEVSFTPGYHIRQRPSTKREVPVDHEAKKRAKRKSARQARKITRRNLKH